MKSLALILIYSPSCCSKPVFLSFFSRTEKKDDIFLPYSKVYRNEKQKRAGVFIYSQIRSRPRVRVNQLSFDLSYKAVTWLWKTWNIVQMLCLWSTFSSSCVFGKKKKNYILQHIFSCLLRKKESHTGLKQHVGEYIFISRLTIYGGPVVHNITKSPWHNKHNEIVNRTEQKQDTTQWKQVTTQW